MRRLHAETAPHFKAVEAKRSQRSRAAATIQSQQLPGNKLTEMNDKKKKAEWDVMYMDYIPYGAFIITDCPTESWV